MLLNSIIIAAGFSSRMGDFKPLLLYRDEAIIISIIKKINFISDKIYIVTGFKEDELVHFVQEYFQGTEVNKKIVFVSNSNYQNGMFTSLQKGVEKGKECDWILYHFVDQPHLPQNFYREFYSQIDDKFDWIQPAFGGKKGHPILINKSLFDNIIYADENSTLKKLNDELEINKKVWNCEYNEVLDDIDTLEDYIKLINDEYI